jgi:Flp pilus assembly protein TadG
MPAGVLVMLVLTAIAIDYTILLLGEREVADVSAAAANDAVIAAVGRDALYGCAALDLDLAAANAAVQRVVAARGSDAVTIASAGVVDIGTELFDGSQRPRVTVTTSGTVDLIFTPAVPGASLSRAVQATATAVAAVGGPDAEEVGVGACPAPAP